MSGIVAGTEVVVRDEGLIVPQEYPGHVVKVGRKLVTIAWNGREAAFRLADHRIHDYRGEQRFTLPQAQETGTEENR